ncbi:urease accessory protein UreF 1 [Mycolicibacterium canariasense]|uniref:Urease accessory protein UreF 1 n=1 Tax=Mycolicibacterium canariasense TaxID=228230 RepID=A0A117I9C3_MYCCR|nr:urease accessory UreF family protein [Mycolicibacterium canariasense]MCV7208607.1 urease accessory protein UreF [Mycolicibacterium canariasense]ORV07302.1 urease accessory protein UreF [Mycolicibacterium canariasense]GAS94607.1 urease accessory protein UreF 1 [Mycolicibacterium canariasense]
MADHAALVAAIRFADSAFPSGGFAFSSGLEGAHRDGLIGDEDGVTAYAAEQLDGRWHRGERVILRRAWAEPVGADRLAEASATMSVLRQASRRAGAATLTTFAAFTRGVAGYRAAVSAGDTPGHLPVAQAVCLRAAGLDLQTAEAVTAWQAVSGITGAALRLGICGHLGVQRVHTALTPLLVDILHREPPAWPAPFTAFADIAAQRRTPGVRLFAS